MASKVVATIFGFILCLIISILVMIYGWGLEPKSWFWIIVGGVVVRGIIGLMEAISKQK